MIIITRIVESAGSLLKSNREKEFLYSRAIFPDAGLLYLGRKRVVENILFFRLI